MEEDLKAYFNVLSGYMEEKVDFEEFRQELEERRMKGITMDCKLTLSLQQQETYFNSTFRTGVNQISNVKKVWTF